MLTSKYNSDTSIKYNLILWMFSVFIISASSTAAEVDHSDKASISWVSGIPIAAAIIAAVGAYLFNIRLERRKAQLKFVSDQLQFLYGPLTALSNASKQAWRKFREENRPGGPFFSKDSLPSSQELESWRLWMEKVFMPINVKMETVIIENTHLIQAHEMPECFKDLLAHVETYRAVIDRWPKIPTSDPKDYREIIVENTARLNFPDEFDRHVSGVFVDLKKRQTELMGKQ